MPTKKTSTPKTHRLSSKTPREAGRDKVGGRRHDGRVERGGRAGGYRAAPGVLRRGEARLLFSSVRAIAPLSLFFFLRCAPPPPQSRRSLCSARLPLAVHPPGHSKWRTPRPPPRRRPTLLRRRRRRRPPTKSSTRGPCPRAQTARSITTSCAARCEWEQREGRRGGRRAQSVGTNFFTPPTPQFGCTLIDKELIER